MKISRMIVGVCCSGLLAACGGGGGSPSTQVDTGLAEDKTLSEVTLDEQRSACEHMRGTVQSVLDPDAMLDSVCTMVSAATTTSPSECNDAHAECLDTYQSQREEFAADTEFDCEPNPAEFANCNVTVGVLETCLSDSLALFQQMLNRYSCADAGHVDQSELEGMGNVEPPASCQPLVDECGGAGMIFGGEDE